LPACSHVICPPAGLLTGTACALACLVFQWAAAPRAQELKLIECGCGALAPQALAQPSMPRLRSLELHVEGVGGLGAELFAPLCAAPWFSQLQELNLSTDQGFGSRGLAPLRSAPLLRKLSIQHYACGGPLALTASDGRALAAAALPVLRELRIHGAGPGFVAALAAAPWLGELESLDVTGAREGPVSGLSAADGRALAAAPVPSLRRLEVGRPGLEFLAACSPSAWLCRLERLTLRGDGGLLGGGGGLPEGSAAWPAAPFTALASLALDYFGTAPPSEASHFAALVSAAWFGRLQQLHVRGCPLGSSSGSDAAGLRALAAASLPNLTSLSLSGACLSAADVSGVLSSAPWLSCLTSLSLACSPLGAPGHLALSLLPMPRLRALILSHNGFDGTGLAALATAPWLTQLAELTLNETLSASPQSRDDVLGAIANDAWVFGRMRRRGCAVVASISSLDTYDDTTVEVSGGDEPGSDDEFGSGDELASGDGPRSGDEPGSDPGGDG
jgi:hypothetical protein